jgi:DNA repair photolyase
MAKVDGCLDLFPILDSAHPPSEPKGIAAMAARAEVTDEGHNVEFRSMPARSILNHTNSRRGFGFSRSINPYRGCEFGCQYCYARYTHEFMELRDPRAFERQIYMKENAAWLLRQELRNLRPGESIAIGTATDPYQPIERDAKITRGVLEVLASQHDLHLGIVTKSTLVTRDIDLLDRIRRRNRISVSLTVTTLDSALARILEPRAPRPDLRLKALVQLRRAGVRAGVLCSPLLPGITDTYSAIDGVAAAARDAGVSFFHADPLFLKPCSRPVFEEFVAQHYPELLESYRERFRERAFASPAYRKRIEALVQAIKAKRGWAGHTGGRIVREQVAREEAQMELISSGGKAEVFRAGFRPPRAKQRPAAKCDAKLNLAQAR